VISPQTSDDDFSESESGRLVERVLTERFEQGCWLAVAEAREFALTDEQAALLEGRWSRIADELILDKLESLEASTLPGLVQDIGLDDLTDRYIILTQQCDLIREPLFEPTIEVAHARWESDPNKIGAGRNLKSWREIVVAEVEGKDDQHLALIANSRRRSLLDKRALISLPARQALPDQPDTRRRFAYWAGARYYRRPVPHDLAVRVERPFRTCIRKDAAARALANEFLMFVLVVEEGDALRLLAIHEREIDGERLERAFAELCELVPFNGLTAEECEIRHIAQAPMTWAFGANAYPLDTESQSGRDDPLPPALTS